LANPYCFKVVWIHHYFLCLSFKIVICCFSKIYSTDIIFMHLSRNFIRLYLQNFILLWSHFHLKNDLFQKYRVFKISFESVWLRLIRLFLKITLIFLNYLMSLHRHLQHFWYWLMNYFQVDRFHFDCIVASEEAYLMD